jgi:hypothetical protein
MVPREIKAVFEYSTLGAHAKRGLQYLVCLRVCQWHYRVQEGLSTATRARNIK